MKTVLKPAALSLGSAAIHIRSSPTTWVEPGLGEMNVLPSSLDLPVVMFTRLSRLEKARLSAVGVGKLGSAAVSLGPIAQSQSPPPALWSGAPMNLAVEPAWLTRIALHCSPVGPITKDSPRLLVRMLGSAAPPLPGRRRFGLNVDAGGGAAAVGATTMIEAATAATPDAMASSRKDPRFILISCRSVSNRVRRSRGEPCRSALTRCPQLLPGSPRPASTRRLIPGCWPPSVRPHQRP